jgi:uncharacterized membrane protein
MGAGFSDLLIAMATFVGGHFILSSLPVRHALIEWIGDTGFRILYSVLAGVTLYWTINRYGAAPYQEVWPMVPALMPGLMLIMLPACLLFAAALTTRLPTAVGGERMVQDTKPLGGIMTVTRHPMLWSFVLWALGHGVVNGDVASLILFGGIAVLSLGGMAHIDHRRQHQTGAEWGPIALSTSAVPFLAAIQGRTKIDWAGIGLARLALGLALYAGLLVAHRWIAGVALVNFG